MGVRLDTASVTTDSHRLYLVPMTNHQRRFEIHSPSLFRTTITPLIITSYNTSTNIGTVVVGKL